MIPNQDRSVDGLSILVSSIYFAPDGTGIAPYASAFVEHIATVGASTTVWTGVPHYPSWRIPPKYRARLKTTEAHGDAPVLRLRHHVPKVVNTRGRLLYELTYGAHVILQRMPTVDVVVSVAPSLAGAAATSELARRQGIPIVLWLQDMTAAAVTQSGVAVGASVVSATSWLERRVVRCADQIIVISDAFARQVVNMGCPPGRVSVVANWSHVSAPHADRAATRQRLGWDDDEIVVLHSGNMGRKQGLESVVDAARLAGARNMRIRFVLMGDGSEAAMLRNHGRDAPCLEFRSPAPEEELMDVLAAADVLLVNERPTVLDMSLPSKLTTYFRSGRPVLACVNPEGVTRREVERSGGGRVVPAGDPDQMLTGIHELADPALASRLGRAGARYAADHLDAASALTRMEDIIVRAAARSR